ncbi:MAG: hypothetical protein ACOY45_10540 [Pseudomonadota bacterium]
MLDRFFVLACALFALAFLGRGVLERRTPVPAVHGLAGSGAGMLVIALFFRAAPLSYGDRLFLVCAAILHLWIGVSAWRSIRNSRG